MIDVNIHGHVVSPQMADGPQDRAGGGGEEEEGDSAVLTPQLAASL